jgi:hypothetical protein
MRFFPRSKVPRFRGYWTKTPEAYMSGCVRYSMYFNDKAGRGLLSCHNVFTPEQMQDRRYVANQLRQSRAMFRAEVSGIYGYHPERWT